MSVSNNTRKKYAAIPSLQRQHGYAEEPMDQTAVLTLKMQHRFQREQPIRRERHLRLHSSSLPPLALSFKSRNPTEVHRIRALLYMEWTCQSNKVVRRLDSAFHCVWPSHGYPKQAVPFAPQA